MNERKNDDVSMSTIESLLFATYRTVIVSTIRERVHGTQLFQW